MLVVTSYLSILFGEYVVIDLLILAMIDRALYIASIARQNAKIATHKI